MSEEKFIASLRGRVKLARETRTDFSQEDMAKALGVDKARYQKWENRSAMPLFYLERFILITKCDPLWLLFGKGQKPVLRWVTTPGARNRA